MIIRCDICGREFDKPSRRNQHVKDAHNKAEDSVTTKPPSTLPAAKVAEPILTDERALFEKWTHEIDHDNGGLCAADCYSAAKLERCWEGWQARAALGRAVAPSDAAKLMPEKITPVQGGLTPKQIGEMWDRAGLEWDSATTYNPAQQVIFARAIEQHVLASQSAAPVAESDAAARQIQQPVGEVILFGGECKEVAWVKGKMPAPGTKLYAGPLAASGSAQPVSEQDAIRAAYTPPPRANLSKGNLVGQGLRLAESIATQAEVTGAQSGAGDDVQLLSVLKEARSWFSASGPLAVRLDAAIKAMAPGVAG